MQKEKDVVDKQQNLHIFLKIFKVGLMREIRAKSYKKPHLIQGKDCKLMYLL